MESDNKLVSFALDLWANYIETYCVSISAEDARSKIYPAKNHYEPNQLGAHQLQLVKRLRYLAKEYKEKIDG